MTVSSLSVCRLTQLFLYRAAMQLLARALTTHFALIAIGLLTITRRSRQHLNKSKLKSIPKGREHQ